MTDTVCIKKKRRLDACVEDVERGTGLIKNAITIIHDEELWKADSQYSSFHDFCFKKWGICKSSAYNIKNHQAVLKNLTEEGVESTIVEDLPESATRPIRDLEPSQQAEVVNKASESGETPTARKIQEARDEVAPKETQPQQDVSDFFGKNSPETSTPRPRESQIKDMVGAKRQKAVKTCEALFREIDDLNEMVPDFDRHSQALSEAGSVLAIIREWK